MGDEAPSEEAQLPVRVPQEYKPPATSYKSSSRIPFTLFETLEVTMNIMNVLIMI
jgi:hypothetical protein